MSVISTSNWIIPSAIKNLLDGNGKNGRRRRSPFTINIEFMTIEDCCGVTDYRFMD
jgi:hypothetical protein